MQTPSLSLTPRTDGAVSLVAGRRTSGDLRIFDADGAEPPRRTSTVRIKGFTQGAKVFRRPDGGLNLVWVSATRGYEGLMGAHRGPTSRRFSTPKPLSRSVLTRGSVFLDDAVQLPDGNVAIAYSRSGKTDFDVYGLIAKP